MLTGKTLSTPSNPLHLFSEPSIMKIYTQNLPQPSLEKIQGNRVASSDHSPLAVGEILHVQVVEKSGSSRFILDARKMTISAESNFPLTQGEKLTVRVEQLSPNIILSLVNREDPSAGLTRGHTLHYLAHPEALGDLFEVGRELLNQKSLIALLPEKAKARVGSILKIMDDAVLSPKSLKNPLFVKDYVANLGLLLEYSLRKMVQGKEGKPEEGLKGILMALAEELRTQKGGEIAGKEGAPKIEQLIKFAEASTRTIENQQMVNISYRENSGHYILQLPILCPEGIKTGELFIETEKEGEGGRGEKKYGVIMFLNLDALGDIMVDASLTGKKLTCLFKFDDPESLQFFSPFLEELKNNINGLGYDCGLLQCLLSKRIRETREDYHSQLFRDCCEINVLI